MRLSMGWFLALLVVATTACATYRDVPLSTAAAELVRTAPGVTVVHYEEYLSVGSIVTVSAPTARIKRGFLEAVAARGRLGPVRDVTTARFPYLDVDAGFVAPRMYAPRVDRLRRTFGTGLVLDFYSQNGHLPIDRIPHPDARLTVVARLSRLDDLSLLWLRLCHLDVRVDRVRLAAPEPRVEQVLTGESLAAADRCGRELADAFLTGLTR